MSGLMSILAVLACWTGGMGRTRGAGRRREGRPIREEEGDEAVWSGLSWDQLMYQTVCGDARCCTEVRVEDIWLVKANWTCVLPNVRGCIVPKPKPKEKKGNTKFHHLLPYPSLHVSDLQVYIAAVFTSSSSARQAQLETAWRRNADMQTRPIRRQ